MAWMQAAWLVWTMSAIGAEDPETWPQYRPSELDLVRQVPVEVPPETAQLELGEVRCEVRVWIAKSGRPVDVALSACPEGLHDAVTTAVRKWRWVMPTVGGRRSPGRVDMAVRFRVGTTGRRVIDRDAVPEKVPQAAREAASAFEPHVLPIEVPTTGSVPVEGAQPWALPSVDLVLLEREAPGFPRRVLDDGLYDDACDARVQVSASGTIDEFDIVGCASAFANATEQALKRWAFEPPMLDGEAVAARVRFAVIFRAYPDSFYEGEEAPIDDQDSEPAVEDQGSDAP